MSDDATYGKYLTTIADIAVDRDALAAEIKTALDAAAFNNQPIDEQQEDLVRRARKIIGQVEDLAGHDDDHH
jgi:hypothetical protein